MQEVEQQGRFRFFVQIVAAVVAVVLTIKLGKILVNSGLLDLIRSEMLKEGLFAVVHLALLRLAVLLALTYLIARYSFPRWKLVAVLAPPLPFFYTSFVSPS